MKRISEYTNITTVAENDILPIVDVSDTSQATTGSTRKGTIEKIADYLKSRVETLTNKTLTSPVINTPTGDVVTPTGTQTLTNKTLSTDDNTFLGFLDWFYPIGTIYETTSTDLDTTTKMNAHFGGTWEVFGSGRVLVAKSTDSEFDTIGETGGEKTHTLTVGEMPSHAHYDGYNGASGTSTGYNGVSGNRGGLLTQYTGGDGAHNNLQPYIVVFRYRRVS